MSKTEQIGTNCCCKLLTLTKVETDSFKMDKRRESIRKPTRVLLWHDVHLTGHAVVPSVWSLLTLDGCLSRKRLLFSLRSLQVA